MNSKNSKNSKFGAWKNLEFLELNSKNSKNSKFGAWKNLEFLELNSKNFKNFKNSKLELVQLPQIQLWILKILNLELGKI